MNTHLQRLASLPYNEIVPLPRDVVSGILTQLDKIEQAYLLNNKRALSSLFSIAPVPTDDEITDILVDEPTVNLALYTDDVVILGTILNGNKNEAILLFLDYDIDSEPYIIRRQVSIEDPLTKMKEDLDSLIKSQYEGIYYIPEKVYQRIGALQYI